MIVFWVKFTLDKGARSRGWSPGIWVEWAMQSTMTHLALQAFWMMDQHLNIFNKVRNYCYFNRALLRVAIDELLINSVSTRFKCSGFLQPWTKNKHNQIN